MPSPTDILTASREARAASTAARSVPSWDPRAAELNRIADAAAARLAALRAA